MSENRKRQATATATAAAAETNILDLPSDALLRIITKLYLRDCSNLTLVSKSFQALTDESVRTLTFRRLPSDSEFRSIFSRFTSVTRIVISFSDWIGRALIAISMSQLKIEVLKIYGVPNFPNPDEMVTLSGKLGNVKVLKFECILTVDHLPQAIEFVQLFPSLEKLDMSSCFRWGNIDIEKLLTAGALGSRKNES